MSQRQLFDGTEDADDAEWPATRSDQEKHAGGPHQAIDTRDAAYEGVMREEQGDLLNPDVLDELGPRQERVYRALVEAGLGGATNDELEARTGLPANVVTPRTYELRGCGEGNPWSDDPLVVPLRREGERVKRETEAGSKAQVWVAVAVLEAEVAGREAGGDAMVESPTPRQPPERGIRRITIR